MNNASRSLGSLFSVLVFGIIIALSGCENPGSIGSNLGGADADLVVDTFAVQGVGTSQFNSYSGDFNYFSAGQYQDPLFGDIKATALVKPGLPASDSEIGVGANMLMRLIINGNQIYGDSLAAQEFDIYKIDERWRGRAFLVKDSIRLDRNTKVGSFTVEGKDSLDIPLSDEWFANNYRSYARENADSLYEQEVNGLALVPTNGNKILPINSQSMNFVIQTPDDTIQTIPNNWAYSLERTNDNTFPEGSEPIYSTYEQVINFGQNFSDIDIRGTGISKAELVFYRNNNAMEQSLQSEPTSVVRPDPGSARLHLANPNQAPINLDPGTPIAAGAYSETDGAYHFNVTNFIQSMLNDGLPENQKFYITFTNNGTIRSSLIYNNQAPSDKSPKLIITSIKSSDN